MAGGGKTWLDACTLPCGSIRGIPVRVHRAFVLEEDARKKPFFLFFFFLQPLDVETCSTTSFAPSFSPLSLSPKPKNCSARAPRGGPGHGRADQNALAGEIEKKRRKKRKKSREKSSAPSLFRDFSLFKTSTSSISKKKKTELPLGLPRLRSHPDADRAHPRAGPLLRFALRRGPGSR
jgi:hypothetical protein